MSYLAMVDGQPEMTVGLKPFAEKYVELPPTRGEFDVIALRVIDGDTFDFGFIIPRRARLARVQAPEMKEEAGQQAKEALASKVQEGKRYRIALLGPDKCDRQLVEVFDENGQSINQWLLDEKIVNPW